MKMNIRTFFNKLKTFVRNLVVSVNEQPIIVAGNQKSGTSAIAHLLADYGGLSKTIDIPPLWQRNGLEIAHGQRSFTEVVERYPYFFSSDLVKEPMMTFFLDEVVSRFPQAKYVCIVRDPRDNIRSLLDARGLPGDRRELRERDVEHLSDQRVVLDSEAWNIDATNYISLLAKRWVSAIQNIENITNEAEVLKVVKYEDFMGNRRCFIRDLAGVLEVDKKRDIKNRVSISFQPGGTRDVNWVSYYGEYNYNIINTICGDVMGNLKYDKSNEQPIYI